MSWCPSIHLGRISNFRPAGKTSRWQKRVTKHLMEICWLLPESPHWPKAAKWSFSFVLIISDSPVLSSLLFAFRSKQNLVVVVNYCMGDFIFKLWKLSEMLYLYFEWGSYKLPEWVTTLPSPPNKVSGYANKSLWLRCFLSDSNEGGQETVPVWLPSWHICFL